MVYSKKHLQLRKLEQVLTVVTVVETVGLSFPMSLPWKEVVGRPRFQ